MAASQQTRTLVVKADVGKSREALESIAKSMGFLNNNVAKLSKSSQFLNNKLSAGVGSLAAYFGTREIINAADSMQLLSSRINVLAGDSEEGARRFQSLTSIANKAGATIDSVATIYTRVGTATKELNLSSSQLENVTTALIDSFRLSGATTAEATSSTIQLAQALGSGALRGQELRSVVEGNITLAQIIAKEFGISTGQLIKFGEQGKLLSDKVLVALLKAQQGLRKETEGLGTTFEQSFNRIQNAVSESIGIINKETGLSSGFATIAQDLSSGIPTATREVINFSKVLRDLFNSFGEYRGISFLFLEILKEIPGGVGDAARKIEELEAAINRVSGVTKPAEKAIADFSAKFTDPKNFSVTQFTDSISTFSSGIGVLKKELASVEGRGPLKFGIDPSTLQNLDVTPPKALFDYSKALAALNQKFSGTKRKEINEYNKELLALDYEKLEDELAKGAIGLDKLDFERNKLQLRGYKNELRALAITEEQFNMKVKENQLEEVNLKYRQGAIDVQDYRNEMLKIRYEFLQSEELLSKQTWVDSSRIGIQRYVQSVKPLAQQLADAFQNAFSTLEDSLFEFTKTGKFNFADFAQSVLDDLNKVLIRSLIVKQIASGVDAGIGALLGGPSPASPATAGGGFGSAASTSPSTSYLGAPTFNYGSLGGGQTSAGMAGVSGKTTVNITNNTSSEITPTQSTGPNGEQFLDFLIESKVKNAISSGSMDKSFNQSYGLKRRGF